MRKQNNESTGKTEIASDRHQRIHRTGQRNGGNRILTHGIGERGNLLDESAFHERGFPAFETREKHDDRGNMLHDHKVIKVEISHTRENRKHLVVA